MHKNITFFILQKRSLASKEALHSPNYYDPWLGFLYYNLISPPSRGLLLSATQRSAEQLCGFEAREPFASTQYFKCLFNNVN